MLKSIHTIQKLPASGWLLLLLLLGLLFTPTSAAAQTKSFYWERFDVEMTLLENGDIDVVETQVLNFSGEPFTFGYGTILTGSAGNNDAIINIALREGDLIYSESSSNLPGTFNVSQSRDEVQIDWYFEPALGQNIYTFSYTVKGGVIVGTDEAGSGDQIFWKAIPTDHPGLIQNSTVTIRLPEGVQPQRYSDSGNYLVEGFAGGNSDLVTTRVSDNGRILTYNLTQPLLNGDAFEVRVQFPHAILNIPVPEWQQRQQNYDVYALIVIAISVLGLLGGPLAVVALWYMRGRDPETGLILPDYLPEPPSALRPAVVGTLIDEKADMRDIIATLIDLAQRGYINIRENRLRNPVFTLENEVTADLRPYEAQFLRDIFRRKKKRSLATLRYRFANRLPKLKEMLYDELLDGKLIDRSPDKVRKKYTVAAVLIFIVSVIIIIGMAALLPTEIGYVAFFPAAALFVTAVALGIAGRHMSTKTAKGAEERAKWVAFRTYLRTIEKYQDLEQAVDLFEKYLPYATAFGIDSSWIRKFTAVPNTPMPRWYYPYGIERTIQHSGSATAIGGAASKTASLDSAAKGMAGGLESMSAGLTKMLNSTASILRSTRSSSSSSGSSSGGFSGGSSGGGGSRGFG
jgi:uncharacterized membrane protein YgcG